MCIKDDCPKYGEMYCVECGQLTHRKRDHAFDINADYIKPIALESTQTKIDEGLQVLKKAMATHYEQQYGIIQGYQGGLVSFAWSLLVSDVVSEGKNVQRLTQICKTILSKSTEMSQQGALMGAMTDVAVETSKLAAEGALYGSVIMAGFEIVLHTARFMSGDIKSWKEYGYYVSKGITASVAMGIGNWGGTTVGVTIGTLVGGPVGALIGGIIGGIVGGIIGVKLGRKAFEQICPDDFIQNEQNVRNKMIKDALLLFGYADVGDIENADIFNEREIKREYRKLAKRYHPDKNGGSPESHANFHEINAALGLLLSLLNTKSKKNVVKKLKEVRAIKLKRDIQKLCGMLKNEEMMCIVDILTKWNKDITIEMLATMSRADLLELIKELNDDQNYKHKISVVKRNKFANIVEKWSDEYICQ